MTYRYGYTSPSLFERTLRLIGTFIKELPSILGTALWGVILLAFNAAVFALIVAWPAQWLWNECAVSTFHAPHVGFWPAFGLLILARIIKG